MFWDADFLLGLFGGSVFGALWMAARERGDHNQARSYRLITCVLYLLGAFGATHGARLW